MYLFFSRWKCLTGHLVLMLPCMLCPHVYLQNWSEVTRRLDFDMPPFDRDHHVGRRADWLRGEGKRDREQHYKSRGTTGLLSTSYSTDTLQEAERLKQEGNDHFRSKAWEEALAQYRSALGHLPRRKPEPPREPVGPPEASGRGTVEIPTSEKLPATPPQPSEESPEIVKTRAVLNANVGACYIQLVGKLFCWRLLFIPVRHRENTKKLSKHVRKVAVESHLPPSTKEADGIL